MASARQALGTGGVRPLCQDNALLCTEVQDSLDYEGKYTGHDEPAVLFYSAKAGSGNSSRYHLKLPTEPPRAPQQDGTGGTYNFQLHPAFWFGMAMCDTESSPEYTNNCTPDSDANIFDGADPAKPDYIGHHPGTAFMEMQFYPPGWVLWPAGLSCDATHWCAALNIDSLSINQNTGEQNNDNCLETVGVEPVNFAFITRDGSVHAPANPLQATIDTYTPNPSKDLFMNPGDDLIVDMYDTPAGFRVDIRDLTTHQKGTMTASVANGFGQIKFDTNPSATCQVTPYAFHPMYSTSSEHTRVPWAAHSYNVSFSDEIGHFEYCANVDPIYGTCADPGADGDEFPCFPASLSSVVPISGCLGTDVDFNGPVYGANWPGTAINQRTDRQYHASAIQFSSPLFNRSQNYDRVGFETDLPRIEFATNPACDRGTGVNCVNPPVGATFYPIFTTRGGGDDGQCLWQLGGANIPGTKNTFGGTSAAEYGPLLQLTYPGAGGPFTRYNDFRRVLSSNPCRASTDD